MSASCGGARYVPRAHAHMPSKPQSRSAALTSLHSALAAFAPAIVEARRAAIGGAGNVAITFSFGRRVEEAFVAKRVARRWR